MPTNATPAAELDTIRHAASDTEARAIITARLVDMLRAAGYDVHEGEAEDRPDLGMRAHWFSWSTPGMASAEVGDGQASYFGAWLSAAVHWFANAAIPLHTASAERGAAPRSILSRCEAFISGFEDDATQDGVPALLADLRAEIGGAPPELAAALTAAENSAASIERGLRWAHDNDAELIATCEAETPDQVDLIDAAFDRLSARYGRAEALARICAAARVDC